MSSDLNRVIIIGRLTRDPELRYTPNGTAVANFSVANNKEWTQNGEKKEQASFFNCIAWGKLGELIVQYCKSGAKIGLEGKLQQRSWENDKGEKRSVVEIVADNVQFLTPRDANSQQPEGGVSGQQAPVDNNPFSDDDVPF